MRKLLLLVTVVLFSLGANAQEKTKKAKMKGHNMEKMHPNGVMMKDGKMWLILKGKTTIMENEVTMNNGTRVMVNGNYLLKNSTTTLMMKEGEHMNLAGQMMPMKMAKHEKGKMMDGVMMHDGQMMLCMNNNMTMLDKEVTMGNGTRVMVDGSYLLKDATTKRMMKDGEHMNLAGNIVPMNMKKMHKNKK